MHRKEMGAWGETVAAGWLQQHGFSVITRNWKSRRKEIDIIAFRGSCLYFVEVKTRSGLAFGHGEDQVNGLKMKHLKEAASDYLHEHPQWRRIQFDVLVVTGSRENYTITRFEDLS